MCSECSLLVPSALTYTIWARIQFFVHTAKDGSQSEDTKESGLPGLMVDVYIHLRLVSLPLIDLAASSICNLYIAIFGLKKNIWKLCLCLHRSSGPRAAK